MLKMSASGLAYTLTTILIASEYPFGWLNTRVNLAVATLCNKRSLPPVLQAQAVALTVAQAFTIAFELWQVAKEGGSIKITIKSVCGGAAISSAETACVCLESALRTYLLWSCSKQALARHCFVFSLFVCVLEKGKRAKSGSAGEASSSSHSERSNSVGSLKGTGEMHTHAHKIQILI